MAEEEDEVSQDDIDDELSFVEKEVEVQPSISRIVVTKLFGRYSYELVAPTFGGEPSRLILLHGDNGSGKTTILKLVWDILSTAETKGHKSSVAKTPFMTFEINFSDGRKVYVEKEKPQLTGSFLLSVEGPHSERVTAKFIVDSSMSVSPTEDYGTNYRHGQYKFKADNETIVADSSSWPSVDNSEMSPTRAVMSFLGDLSTKPPVLLADDRCLHSDQQVPERNRRAIRAHESDRLSPTERVAEELQAALQRLNNRMLALTSKGQVSGFQEEATIYMDVLRRLGQDRTAASRTNLESDAVELLIQNLSEEVPRFSEFGLVSRFEPDLIRGLLRRVPKDNRQAAYDIIVPYLESLQARLAALNEAERLIRSFVTHANKYLTDKYLAFRSGQGFRVVTDQKGNRVLRPSSLSSGEKQMLLLLCSAILSRWESRLFLIDEPELSLGVVWQRRILSSLLTLTEDTNIQFIVATHSIEIVTANASSLVRLVDIGGESRQLQHS